MNFFLLLEKLDHLFVQIPLIESLKVRPDEAKVVDSLNKRVRFGKLGKIVRLNSLLHRLKLLFE